MFFKLETWIMVFLTIVVVMLLIPVLKEFLTSIYLIFKNLIEGLSSDDKEERKVSMYSLMLGIFMMILLVLIVIKGLMELF